MGKSFVSVLARSTVLSSLVTLLEQTARQRPNLLPVLTYHRVATPDEYPSLYPRVTVTPGAFDEQMRYLAHHSHVVSMPELLDAYRYGASLPPRSVMITFDDAYRDFAEHAWPILRRYRLPVTLFVPTAFPNHPEQIFWWDRLHHAVTSTARREALDTPGGRLPLATAAQREAAFSRLRNYVKSRPHREAMTWVEQICNTLDAPPCEQGVLGWDELRRLAREGVTLGAHTRTHPLVHRVPMEEARAEILGSLRDLEREIGGVPPIFAYPGGGFNDEVVSILEREGFALAFTGVRGINDLCEADRLRLRRINVGPRTTLTLLRAQLLPWSLYFNPWQPLSESTWIPGQLTPPT